MYTLAPGEKSTAVMVYARNKLVYADLVTKENLRVNIWLRTQGVPNYVHLLNARVLLFAGSTPKSLEYQEYFFPTERIIGFHLAPTVPPEQLDYDESEANRTMQTVQLVLGVFTLRGKVRISTQTDLANSLEVSHMTWLTVYDAEISNPFLPQMPVIRVPMMLVNPAQASFGL